MNYCEASRPVGSLVIKPDTRDVYTVMEYRPGDKVLLQEARSGRTDEYDALRVQAWARGFNQHRTMVMPIPLLTRAQGEAG